MSRRVEKPLKSPRKDALAGARACKSAAVADPTELPRATAQPTPPTAQPTRRPHSPPADRTAHPPTATALSIDRYRERMRGWIALALIGLLAFVFMVAFVGLMAGMVSVRDLKELSAIFLGPLIALVGAATGFYFGGAKK